MHLTRLLLVAGFAAWGCSRNPTPVPDTPSPDPEEAVAQPSGPGRPSAVPSATPAPTAAISPEMDPEPTVASLVAAYRGTTDPMDRESYAFDLEALGTPEAGMAIAALAGSETDEELKSMLLTVLADSEAPVETKISALAGGMGVGQTEMVREAAADSLQALEDQRALSVWRQYVNDPLLGDTAKDAIEFLENRKE